MPARRSVAFFGSSLLSAYWNGAATYYRGIVRALHESGYDVTFYEPDLYDRQAHRDMGPVPWATSVVFSCDAPDDALRQVEAASGADVLIKASGIGKYDDLFEEAVLELARPHTTVAFWDVDAPATLDRVHQNPRDPFLSLIPRYDVVFTYGGGPPVIEAYRALGAKTCVPIYNAVDPRTHHPDTADPRFAGDLGFLGNRLPDREARVHRFFFEAARRAPSHQFVLGGSGWESHGCPANVRCVGHVFTHEHNRFNASALAVLNINRASMAQYGYSPATRIFEAAGAGACLMTDPWEGIDWFLEPGREVLVVADAEEVVDTLLTLDPRRARRIGEAARARVLDEHTYAHRVALLTDTLEGAPA